MPNLTIYCEQYGYFWKFTPKQFIELCDKSIRGHPDGFELPMKNGLKRKPSRVYNPDRKPYRSKYVGTAQNAFSTSPDVIVFHPLDWSAGDYKQAKHEVIERMRRFQRKK